MAKERIIIAATKGGGVTNHEVRAYRGSQKVGSASFLGKKGRGAWVKNISVKPGFQRQGIASRMLTAVGKKFGGSVTGSDFSKDGRKLFSRQAGKGKERGDGGWSGARRFVAKKPKGKGSLKGAKRGGSSGSGRADG